MSRYDLSELRMDACGPRDIGLLIKTYHYLHRMPAGILKCFVLLESNNIIPVGGAVFSNGRIQYQGKYLDFSRLWVDDRCPTNTESKFIAYCIKNLQVAFPHFEGIVTWADPKQGHTGTLYKACNFTFDGYSRVVEKYRDLFTKRIIYQRSYVGQEGVVLLPSDEPKKRFIYYFDKRTRESRRKERGDKDNTILEVEEV
tara:strand:+ start:91 stop:687 length:597 start_codon:yes stop_codon:yes gene_type:complete